MLQQQLQQQHRSAVINVVTLLSPSPVRSRQMIQHLQRWTQCAPPTSEEPTNNIVTGGQCNDTTTTNLDSTINANGSYDALDEILLRGNTMNRIVPPWMMPTQRQQQPKLDSVAFWVGTGGSDTKKRKKTTLIHCLALSSDNNAGWSFSQQRSLDRCRTELLAIQSVLVPMDNNNNNSDNQMNDNALLSNIRNRLAAKLTQPFRNESSSASWMETIQASLYNLTQQRPSVKKFLPRHHERLPVLDLNESTIQGNDYNMTNANQETSSSLEWDVGDLKEIVIPVYWSDTYSNDNNNTLFATLADTYQLHRPVTGLYQLSPFCRLCVRPVPMAKEDRRLLSPTLIFHTNPQNLQDLQTRSIEKNTVNVVKIGYTGRSTHGQLLIPDPLATMDGSGVDVRLCSAKKHTSMFAEAQDSLFAGSLSELQSKHVLSSSNISDPKLNQTDCWVEFRANLRHPLGFLPSFKSTSPPHKIAQAPNLPYE
jgi:hypothetical protein